LKRTTFFQFLEELITVLLQNTDGTLYCQGDSGGPLACKGQQDTWTVIGINSFVLRPCVQGVVARVSTYVSWIQQTIDGYA